MTSHDILQQLRHLDRSSPEFHDQLNKILCGREYKQRVPILQGRDLVWLVDYLDNVLDVLQPSSAGFRKCLRELRSICGVRAILPTSYVLSDSLQGVGSMPFTSGGSDDVCKGILDGTRVSVKRARVYTKGNPETAVRALYQEAALWKHLDHQNIVPFLGVTSTPLQLASEWMPGGGLTEYVRNNADADRLELLLGVADGLSYLHSRGVVHGDLKGSSVLVDKLGCARITDFGLANVIQDHDSVGSEPDDRGPTARWIAPEILRGPQGTYSKQADIFAFGMVMIEAFTGAVPFNDLPAATATFAIMEGRRPPRPPHPAFTNELWELVQRCWGWDPQLRPEASQVLEFLRDTDPPAWKRLISCTLGAQERVSLITTIVTEQDGFEMVKYLRGEEAQAFIDAIDQGLDNLEPRIRGRGVRYLRRICGLNALIPRSLGVEVHYDRKERPLCNGGFADVWKGRSNGREVVVKVLRVHLKGDFGEIRGRFCKEVVTWKYLRHPNVLPLLGVAMTGDRFAMISELMTNGNINEFVKKRGDADRLKLLTDVARGLTYMHGQGIVHGDLKGANILVDENHRACLADFGLVTMISDQSTFLSTCTAGGTVRWMSPELSDPGKFGLREIRPTKESDCYALGMVIYEVLSGQKPYTPRKDHAVIRKVLDGERPGRPAGDRGKLFSDDVWRVVQLCWKPRPGDRMNAKAVLLSLEGDPSSLRPSPGGGGDVGADIDGWSDTTSDSCLSIKHPEDELPVSPQSLPRHGMMVASATCRGSRPSLQLRLGGSKGGSMGKLARRGRRIFGAIARRFCGL